MQKTMVTIRLTVMHDGDFTAGEVAADLRMQLERRPLSEAEPWRGQAPGWSTFHVEVTTGATQALGR